MTEVDMLTQARLLCFLHNMNRRPQILDTETGTVKEHNIVVACPTALYVSHDLTKTCIATVRET
jgi:hypothetical protein